jgi:hypothetical protein
VSKGCVKPIPYVWPDFSDEEKGRKIFPMLQRFARIREWFARLSKPLDTSPMIVVQTNMCEYLNSCRDLAFWSVSDAGLCGLVEAFDGSRLHPAADGMCTIRMILRDSRANRSPSEAARVTCSPP